MIANNLISIYNAVDDMFDALVEKGVTVSDRKMNLIPQLVASIKQVAYPSVIPTNNLPTISDKTTAMLQIKAQIKSVIESSGVTATNNLSLFGNYIRSINTGSVLELQGPSTFTGKNYLITATFNGQQVNPSTWSVTAGYQYATINQYGRVDITSGTISQSITVTAQYVDSGNTYTNTLTTTVTYDNQLTIQCSDTITGTRGNCVAVYNENVVTPTWSITSGDSHATINSTGDITITSSGNITVQAVYSGYTTTKNITLVYEANTTTDTTVNEDGSTTTTTTTTTTDPQTGATTTESTSTTTNKDGSQSHTTSETTTNQDGSSTSSSTTTNSDGTSSENTTSVASDGSYSSSTTKYDKNGDPTTGVNETQDADGNNHQQNLEYDDQGNASVVGYTIDTSANPKGEEDITGTGVNTQYVPFHAPNGFTMHMKFRTVASEQPNPPIVEDTEDKTLLYNIMSAKSTTKIGNVWPGFDIRWGGNQNNRTLQFRRTLLGETNSTTTNITATHQNNVYDLTITYDPNDTQYKFRVRNNWAEQYIVQVNKSLQNNLDLEVTLGYAINMQGNPYRYANVSFLEFSVANL